MFIIEDWAGNHCFKDFEFNSFDDAEDFLSNTLDEQYDEERGEFYIVERD